MLAWAQQLSSNLSPAVLKPLDTGKRGREAAPSITNLHASVAASVAARARAQTGTLSGPPVNPRCSSSAGNAAFVTPAAHELWLAHFWLFQDSCYTLHKPFIYHSSVGGRRTVCRSLLGCHECSSLGCGGAIL